MRKLLWVVWLLVSLVIAGFLALGISGADAARNTWLAQARLMLLPGATTSGHHQIELACESCHTRAFAGKDDLQEAMRMLREHDFGVALQFGNYRG